MRFFSSRISFLIVLLCATSAFADLYYWEDKDGNTHITDKIEKVPQEYKDKVSIQQSSEPIAVQDKQFKDKEPKGEELYGGQTRAWWEKRFNKLRSGVDKLERKIISKKKSIDRHKRTLWVDKNETDLNERYAREIPVDEDHLDALKDELDKLLREAQNDGVPKSVRGE